MSSATKQVLKVVLILIIIAVFVLSYVNIGGLSRRSAEVPKYKNPTSDPFAVGPTSSPPGNN